MKSSLFAALVFFASVCCAQGAPASDAKEAEPLRKATLSSGVELTWLATGAGVYPAATSVVTVHYRGILTSGREFDNSYKRGQPVSFPVNKVVKCWGDALQALRVGDKAEVVCPSSMALGDRGVPGAIPPNAILKFEVELLSVQP